MSRPFFCPNLLCEQFRKVEQRMCTCFRKRDGHSRKVDVPDSSLCACGKRELRFAWLVSLCIFPVTDVLALVRCHFVDTEPHRLRLKT